MTKYSKVLLAGGGGVVGQQVAEILLRRNPGLGVVLGGRRPDALRDLAERLGAEAVALDIDAPVLPEGLADAVVVGLANDLHDRLLGVSLRAGLAYVDVTRWTERLKQSLVMVAAHGAPAAPVVFSSAWMAGTAGLVARHAAAGFTRVDSIDIAILFSLADRAGPNSTAYMDRISDPFRTMERSVWKLRAGLRDGHRADFGEGGIHKVYRFDTPDQASLPSLTGAHTVDARIAFDSRASTGLLHGLVASGIWKLISRPAFDGLRRSLLYNPGTGAEHRVLITLTGDGRQDARRSRRLQMIDPSGQTHLTALGAVFQIETILGLHGPATPAGVHLGEAADPDFAVKMLRSEGLLIDEA